MSLVSATCFKRDDKNDIVREPRCEAIVKCEDYLTKEWRVQEYNEEAADV